MENKKLPIHERLKELRKARGWTQNELAEKIDTDARMISHYENGKFVPSAEALIKIAEIFDISIDYLLIEYAIKKPLKDTGDRELMEQFLEVNDLPEKDREMIKYIIDSVLTKDRLKGLIK